MQTTCTVWEATGRDGRVIAQVRTADQDAAYSALTAAIGADPLAAPEGWYFGEGRDLVAGLCLRLRRDELRAPLARVRPEHGDARRVRAGR